MDKSLDELAAASNQGRKRDDRRQGSWQGGGRDDRRQGSWQGGGRDDRRQGSWQGGGWQGWGGQRPDSAARRGSEGQQPAAAASKESYCFFGDSFVRLFGLVRHPEIQVQAFKGATCRGLGKQGNENREEIVRRLKPETRAAIFVFGNVDVHFSYYYSLHGKPVPQRIDFEGIARDYVEFIAGLPGGAGLRRGVVAAYPSSLVDDDKVPASVIAYGILSEEQAKGIDPEDCKLQARQGRVREFNRHLERFCGERGVEYHDLFDELVDAESLVLKPEYLDISDLNIHVIWETTLLLWLQRLPFLKARTKPGFEAQLQASLSKYLDEKKLEFAGKELSVARQHPSEARRPQSGGAGGGAGGSSGAARGPAPAATGEIKVRSLEELLAEKKRKAAAQAEGEGERPAKAGRSLPSNIHTERDALFD